MGLNISKGNMYEFVTHTWNTVKGKCFHDCSYCYMKRYEAQREIYFDQKELKTDLGKDNFIFVGSSCDLFAKDVKNEWIIDTLKKMNEHDNKYLVQSKDPARILAFKSWFKNPTIVCTTIETNRFYKDIMNNCPSPVDRAFGLRNLPFEKYVTIEPILDFDLDEFVDLIRLCQPSKVNIGADSGNNNLPEPSIEKIMMLVEELKKFTTIEKKINLSRLEK